MNDRNDQRGIGDDIGMEAAHHVDRHSVNYCASERQRIETVNQPAILALRGRVAQLRDQERDLQQRIYQAPPPGTVRSRKRKAIFRYAIAVLLALAGFYFARLAFDPYQLGWKAWLYCLGIAVVTPFLVDRILDRWKSQRLVDVVATVAGIAAVASLILLAEVRGDLLAEQVKSAPTAIVTNAEDAPPPAIDNTFYERTLGRLRLLMALLAFAIEIGAGIALHEAGQLITPTGEDAAALRRELAAVQERIVAHAHEVWTLEHAGAAFEHEFWRDFYRSLLNGVKRGAYQKLLLVVLCFGLLAHGTSYASERVDLVVFLDLSKSVAAKGQDNTVEFDKNVQTITRLLAMLPAGTKITVFGITNESFGSPYVLFSAELTSDEGYFKERLAKGRATLVRAWRERAARLAPHCAHTDILGTLLVASEVFHGSSVERRKVLVILSDMRQETAALDLERRVLVQPKTAIKQVADRKLLADLRGVEVYALGVDAAGKSVVYWQSLRDFWAEYFGRCGADLKTYSILRELPELEP